LDVACVVGAFVEAVEAGAGSSVDSVGIPVCGNGATVCASVSFVAAGATVSANTDEVVTLLARVDELEVRVVVVTVPVLVDVLVLLAVNMVDILGVVVSMGCTPVVVAVTVVAVVVVGVLVVAVMEVSVVVVVNVRVVVVVVTTRVVVVTVVVVVAVVAVVVVGGGGGGRVVILPGAGCPAVSVPCKITCHSISLFPDELVLS